MILTVDVGNTRIKAAVFEEDILLQHFVFMKEELKENIENILKKFKNTSHLVVASVGNVEKQSFLEFILFLMMMSSLFLMGMKLQKLWELTGWYLLPEQLCSFRGKIG